MSFSDQQNTIQKQQPALCIKCRQMYGHQTFANMCSKCFKQHKLQAQKQQEKKNATQLPLTLKQQQPLEEKQLTQKTQKNELPSLPKRETQPNLQNKSSERERTREKQQKKTINKCFTCSKKTGMLGHQCKHCSNLFCKFHRLPQDHECGVDFITAGKKILAAAFPQLKARKVSGLDNDN